MQSKAKTKKGLGVFSLILTVLAIANPTIKLVDLFPDFIACYIIAKRLSKYTESAPYFAEAKEAFVNLCRLSLARIPAFFIAAIVKSSNTLDNDITVLFTFVFSVFEAYLLIIAIKNLFSALFYVGMRTGGSPLISAFALTKKRSMTPEALKNLSFVFVVFRALATALPEMLLLSTTNEIGVNTRLFNFRALYPYFVLTLIPLTFIFGIILARRYAKYVRSFTNQMSLSDTVSEMLSPEAREEIGKKLTAKRQKTTFGLFAIAAMLAVDIRISDFSMVDLVPDFLMGVLLLVAILRFSRDSKKQIFPLISACSYIIISLFSYSLSCAHLNEYGYANASAAARSSYSTLLIFGYIELAVYFTAILSITFMMLKFVSLHTQNEAFKNESPKAYAAHAKEMKTKIVAFSFLAITNGILKTVNIFLGYETVSTVVETGSGVSLISSGTAPWFSSLIFLSWIAFFGYSLYLSSYVKEEIDLKYS